MSVVNTPPAGLGGEGRAGRILDIAVTDLALLERVRIELAPGLNVLTGETGAGKSLVIDALGLVLGARAETDLVRHGSDTARVEVRFDRADAPLAVTREVTAAGRSAARIDGTAVTAARLAETTRPLIEVHGQHDQGRLLDERWQRDLLDAHGGHGAARVVMAAAVERWTENREVLGRLPSDAREIARRLDLLEHEVAEVAAADLRVGEADEIRGRLAAGRNAASLIRGAEALLSALDADGAGARESLAAALREARGQARIDGRYEEVAGRIAGLAAEVDDIVSEVRRAVERIDHDPATLAALEERLSTIFALERRYGDDEAAVIAHAERAAEEVERLRGAEAERSRRAAADAELLLEVARRASDLSALRRGASARLGAQVDAALRPLGFPAGAFDVAVGRRPARGDEPAIELDGDAVAFDAAGADDVVFRFAPNAGEPARALARIASGGELSRVALAIKQVLAAVDATPVLVFDEVDAGIGGRDAEPVGRSLAALALRHQVIVVTHLPQIAAFADAHFRIAKHEREGRTVTEIARLDRAGRVGELAAMLGGAADGTSGALLATAESLLETGLGPVEVVPLR